MSDNEIDYDRLLERPVVDFDESAVSERVRGSSVLVTGAGGSIGNELVQLLAAKGAAAIVCVESHEPSLFRLGLRMREQFPQLSVRLALVDARQTNRIGRLIRDHRVDAIFHLAAYKHVPLAEDNCDQVVAVNLLSTLDLIEVAETEAVRSFVYPSTDKAVRPPSMYGATKRLTEIELFRRNTASCRVTLSVARLVNVFGTAGNVIEIFASQIRRGIPISVTDRQMTRYWMTRRESAMLLASSMVLPKIPGVYQLELGDSVPIMSTAERLGVLLTGQAPQISIIGSRPGERLAEELAYSYEDSVASALPGIRQIVSRIGLPDIQDVISALRMAVSEGDNTTVRRLISEAVEAAVAV